jgi:Fis family transcriptional regulator, factor for inversion stimulation protein
MNVRRREAILTTNAGRERIGPKRRDHRAREEALEAITAGGDDEAKGLEALVQKRLECYVDALKGHRPRDLYALIMPQLERPLIRVAMALAEGRQSAAAAMLGIHRNTLRTRIKELGLDAEFSPKPRR